MPPSAIETGLIDFVLAPEAMPSTIIQYVSQPYVNPNEKQNRQRGRILRLLSQLNELLLAETKCDFRSYRTNMLLRRIERRMGLVPIQTLKDYLEYLSLPSR